MLLSASTASAITVSTTGDSGGCSLRQAIVAVNEGNSATACGAVVSGGTTPIALPAGHYTLTAGELTVGSSADLAITGGNLNAPTQTVIDANHLSRVFEITAGGQATLAGVEVTGGQTTNGANETAPLHSGGSGGDGGGILNHGALTLEHVLLTANFTGHGGKGADGDNSATSTRNPSSGGSGGSGGGIYNYSGASLTIAASTISANGTGEGGLGGNAAMGNGNAIPKGADGGHGGYSGSGGGVFNESGGTLTISTTTVSGNFTGRGGQGGNGGAGAGGEHSGAGGYGGDGGGAIGYNPETGNPQYVAEVGGGGIWNAGTLTMTASTISANNTGAGGNGGGAGNGGEGEGGYFQDGGHGGYAGGGGLGGGLLTFGTVYGSGATLTNVTISGNFTGDGGTGGNGAQGEGSLGGGPGGFGGYGGGVWAIGASNGNGLLLTNVTISQNHVGAAGAGGPDGGKFPGIAGRPGRGGGLTVGGRYNPGGAGAYLKNTLIANNHSPADSSHGTPIPADQNCVQYYPPEQYVDIYDLGNNLSYPDATCPGIHADPLLGPLADNGGPTQTMLPGPGSAAIAAIPSASCAVSADQRGFPRPGGGKSGCDIGAVETGTPPGPPVLAVSKLGHGAGTVTSSPAGISCGVDCEEEFELGEVVTLTASPAAGSTFAGWSGGGCTGTGSCQLTLGADTTVTATFTAEPTSPSGSGGTETLATPVVAPVTPPAPPAPKPLTCKKGFAKKTVKGKRRCVRIKHRRHHH